MSTRLFLLRAMVRRDFEGRYAGSLLGLVWSFVQPCGQLLLFTIVFSMVIRVPPDARWPGVGFPALLFAGLLPWMAVNEGVLRSVTAITGNAGAVKKLRFPSEMLVVSGVMASLLHTAIAGLVFITVLVGSQTLALGGLPLLAIAVPLQVLLTVGLGLSIAAVSVFVRDLAHALAMVLMAWFYLTPIVYPVDAVPEQWRGWFAWNPLTPLVGLYRQAFFGGELRLPDGTAALAAIAVVVAIAGSWLFMRLKPSFPDQI